MEENSTMSNYESTTLICSLSSSYWLLRCRCLSEYVSDCAGEGLYRFVAWSVTYGNSVYRTKAFHFPEVFARPALQMDCNHQQKGNVLFTWQISTDHYKPWHWLPMVNEIFLYKIFSFLLMPLPSKITVVYPTSTASVISPLLFVSIEAGWIP